MPYTFFEDPAHGWLRVPLAELHELGIADKISRYSYIGNEFAFLEEDCDAGLFMEASEKLGRTIQVKTAYVDSRSSIRDLERYKP